MTRQRGFWFIIGFIAGFLCAWLSIWATYIALENGHRKRDAELEQVKQIIYYSEDILHQRKEIFDWNRRTRLPAPEWVVGEEE